MGTNRNQKFEVGIRYFLSVKIKLYKLSISFFYNLKQILNFKNNLTTFNEFLCNCNFPALHSFIPTFIQ